jgi:hypothetical protein
MRRGTLARVFFYGWRGVEAIPALNAWALERAPTQIARSTSFARQKSTGRDKSGAGRESTGRCRNDARLLGRRSLLDPGADQPAAGIGESKVIAAAVVDLPPEQARW